MTKKLFSLSLSADACLIVLIGALLNFTGTAILFADYWPVLKPAQKVLAWDVASLEEGVRALGDAEKNKKQAILKVGERGFEEILKVIEKFEKHSLAEVKEIVHKFEHVTQFHWHEDKKTGVIFLHARTGGGSKESVHPVNHAGVVFGWFEQERTKRLTVDSFIYLFLGAILALVGCFASIKVEK